MKPSNLRRGLARAARWTGALVALALVGTLASAWTAFGGRAEGARRERMEHSPQWQDGHFENPQPLYNDFGRSISAMFNASPVASPTQLPLATAPVDPRLWEIPPATGLRVTWFGHSSALIEVDGARVLTDPIWSDRASPLTWAGPTRWYAPPVALDALPKIDAVVISHDHYDHLDHRTVVAMKDWDTTFIVPLGVGAHLESWGVPPARIVELDWWERTQVRGLDIVCTPSRHASGRTGIDKDATLWAGFALLGPKHRAYYWGTRGCSPR